VKNITVSVPDDVYRTARVRAAELDSSVSALVTSYLRTLGAEQERRFEQLEAREREVRERLGPFSARDRLPRSALHDRALR
jgi:plasmid stability protein